jgi:hypothetical protein
LKASPAASTIRRLLTASSWVAEVAAVHDRVEKHLLLQAAETVVVGLDAAPRDTTPTISNPGMAW